MKLFDYLALAVSVAVTVLSLFSALSFNGASLEVHIESDGKEWIYPLDGENALLFTGPVGETQVLIEEGHVLVPHSDCKEKICVQSGSIDGPGEWIACMPNRVFISIRGKTEEGGLDGESY